MNIEELRKRREELAQELNRVSREIDNFDSEDEVKKLSLYHPRKNKGEKYCFIDYDADSVNEKHDIRYSLDYIRYNIMNYFDSKEDAENALKYTSLVVKVFKALSFSNNYKDFDRSGFKHVISIGVSDSKNPYVVTHYDINHQILTFIDSSAAKMFRKLMTDEEIISFYLGLSFKGVSK